jgi:hypothetical protein
MGKLVAKQVRVPEPLWRAARAMAIGKGETLQGVIHRLLKEYLEEAK